MKYRITISNQFLALKAILVLFAFSVFFVVYIINSKGNFTLALEIFSIYFIISFLPVLYLHIEYYYFNKGTEIDIESSENKLIYTNKSGEKETIYFHELSKLVFYMDRTWHIKSNFRLSPIACYYYAIIFTNRGEEIIMTSLMTPMIEDALSIIPGLTIEKKVRLFASILIR